MLRYEDDSCASRPHEIAAHPRASSQECRFTRPSPITSTITSKDDALGNSATPVQYEACSAHEDAARCFCSGVPLLLTGANHLTTFLKLLRIGHVGVLLCFLPLVGPRTGSKGC